MPSPHPPLIVIAGPTASGKSALAVSAAQQIGGVIVNADSAQIYRDLPVLSAIPSAEDRARAEHRLFAERDGALPCSAAEWAALARDEITRIHRDGRVPILAGGTGLYLRTLLDGIAPVPTIDPKVRAQIRSSATFDNRAKLEVLDPEAAARLKPADSARIARALEVILSTGRTLADWQKQRAGGIVDSVELRPLILLPPRDWLYRRCDERFAAMVEQGGVDEVRRLLERGLDPDAPVMRAIGVAELGRHLRGEATLEDAIAAGQQATRRYAKRQYTWFTNQPPPGWPRLREPLDADHFSQALALLGAGP